MFSIKLSMRFFVAAVGRFPAAVHISRVFDDLRWCDHNIFTAFSDM
jgi:hypothetical protein